MGGIKEGWHEGRYNLTTIDNLIESFSILLRKNRSDNVWSTSPHVSTIKSLLTCDADALLDW